jgi:hypothetical protein
MSQPDGSQSKKPTFVEQAMARQRSPRLEEAMARQAGRTGSPRLEEALARAARRSPRSGNNNLLAAPPRPGDTLGGSGDEASPRRSGSLRTSIGAIISGADDEDPLRRSPSRLAAVSSSQNDPLPLPTPPGMMGSPRSLAAAGGPVGQKVSLTAAAMFERVTQARKQAAAAAVRAPSQAEKPTPQRKTSANPDSAICMLLSPEQNHSYC